MKALMLPRWKTEGNTRRRFTDGFLLPAVIALGLGVSTVSILALQTVAQNSSSLNEQYYTQLAREAALSGINAAKYCMEKTTILQGATWTSTALTPQRDCNLAPIYSSDLVTNNTSAPGSAAVGFTTTYSVPKPTPAPGDSSGRTWVVASTGTLKIKGPGGSTNVKTIAKTLRAYMVSETSGGGSGYRQVSKLSAGPATACTIANDPIKNRDWAYCWGDNSNEQLGTNFNYRSNRSTVPAAVTSSPSEAQTTTTINPCGSSGRPSCASADPTAINFDGKKVVDISVGIDHTCMIATDLNGNSGRAYCWGNNNYGQLGRGSATSVRTRDSAIPIAVDTSAGAMGTKNVTAISAGNGFTCAIADNSTYCWGRNDHGQAGSSRDAEVYSPAAVSTSIPMKKLAKVYGGATMCGISTNGDGYCWGQSFAGQRGDGYLGDNFYDHATSGCRSGGGAVAHVGTAPLDTSRDRLPPSLVIGGHKFSSISIIGTGIPNASQQGRFASYVTGQSSVNGRMYYWGGTTSYSYTETITGCHGTENDHVATATISRTYTGPASPSGPLYNSGSTDLNGQALGLNSGNAFNGYFCAQPATTSSPIYCDVHSSSTSRNSARNGQLGNGGTYPCTIPYRNCPLNRSYP